MAFSNFARAVTSRLPHLPRPQSVEPCVRRATVADRGIGAGAGGIAGFPLVFDNSQPRPVPVDIRSKFPTQNRPRGGADRQVVAAAGQGKDVTRIAASSQHRRRPAAVAAPRHPVQPPVASAAPSGQWMPSPAGPLKTGRKKPAEKATSPRGARRPSRMMAPRPRPCWMGVKCAKDAAARWSFVVQIGAFAEAAKRSKLEKSGLKSGAQGSKPIPRWCSPRKASASGYASGLSESKAEADKAADRISGADPICPIGSEPDFAPDGDTGLDFAGRAGGVM